MSRSNALLLLLLISLNVGAAPSPSPTPTASPAPEADDSYNSYGAIDPKTFGRWLDSSDLIDEAPPFLSGYKLPPKFPVGPCAADRPNSDTELKRFCFATDKVAGPDPRLKPAVTPDDRLALVRYYATKYSFPVSSPMTINTDWFTRASSNEGGGANAINIVIGMARWRLEMEHTNETFRLDKLTEQVKSANLPESVLKSATLASIPISAAISREQRLLDYWFPDSPLWTTALLDSCSKITKRSAAKASRICCFTKIAGCSTQKSDQ